MQTGSSPSQTAEAHPQLVSWLSSKCYGCLAAWTKSQSTTQARRRHRNRIPTRWWTPRLPSSWWIPLNSILRRISLQPHPKQNLSSFFLPIFLPSLPPPNAHCATGVQHWLEYSNVSLQKLNRRMCIPLCIPQCYHSTLILPLRTPTYQLLRHPCTFGDIRSYKKIIIHPPLKLKGHVRCRQASSKVMQLYLILIQPHPQTSPKQKLVQVPTHTSKSATPIAIPQTDSSSHTYPWIFQFTAPTLSPFHCSSLIWQASPPQCNNK